MADKGVISNIEGRVRQLMDDHRRVSELCASLTAQRDALRAEKRSQRAEGLAGGSRNREKARARVNRLMREVDKCIALAEQPFDASSAPETRTAE